MNGCHEDQSGLGNLGEAQQHPSPSTSGLDPAHHQVGRSHVLAIPSGREASSGARQNPGATILFRTLLGVLGLGFYVRIQIEGFWVLVR